MSLSSLPVEITVDIACHLDFASFDNLLVLSSRFRAILTGYWVGILRRIIEREFSPGDGFIKSFLGLPNGVNDREELGLWLMGMARRTSGMATVFNYCRSVKLWEEEFQRLRFYYCSDDSRILEQHELRRLRQGLYVWRRFARGFHQVWRAGGGGGRDGDEVPPWRGVTGALSTTQLHEVNDMWETIWAGVGREICPSVAAVRELFDDTLSKGEAERIGWGEDPENAHILSTIMRLSPEDILHLLVYRHRYATKASVVQFVRMRNPWIEDSTETFSAAILYAQRDGQKLMDVRDPPFPVPGFPGRYGGIVDHERPETEQARVLHSTDGWKEAPHHGQSGRRDHRLHTYMVSNIRRGRLVISSYGC